LSKESQTDGLFVMAIPSARVNQDIVAAYVTLERSLKTTTRKAAVGAANPGGANFSAADANL
jgi:hypothetical protein